MMKNKLKLIKILLNFFIDKIDAGTCDLDEQELDEIIDTLQKINATYLSKYQAYTYLNVSRATFDNLVADGKLPQGKKVAGFKELMWEKQDIVKYITKRK